MTWKGLWEGIAAVFEDALFLPYDALRKLELDSWFLANTFSWIFLLIAAAAFVYWCIQLDKYNEDTESHYTYDETI